jgi:hypothetical protein
MMMIVVVADVNVVEIHLSNGMLLSNNSCVYVVLVYVFCSLVVFDCYRQNNPLRKYFFTHTPHETST